METKFSHQKATQGINYFCREEKNAIDKMKVLKLIFFADRYHLRKYGRFVTNDEYYAMEYGPVASNTKDILELNDFLGESEKKYATIYLEQKSLTTITSLKEVDFDVFSKSDKEALQFAWDKFGHKNNFDLSEYTHKYPEWLKHEEKLKTNLYSRIKMNMEDFFEDSLDKTMEKCFSLTNEQKELWKIHLKNIVEIEQLWG